jgi:tetratricopeptide (TPR) repeat protein
MCRFTLLTVVIVNVLASLACCGAPGSFSPPRGEDKAAATPKRSATAEAEAAAKNKANREAYDAEVRRLKAEYRESLEEFRANKDILDKASEADAAARNKANREAYAAEVARLKAKRQESVEKFAVAKEGYDKAVPEYQKAKAEYDAAKQLAVARPPAGTISKPLREVALRKYREIIKLYPDTQAAKEAVKDVQILLDDAYVFIAARKLPPEPVQPVMPESPVLNSPPPPEDVAVVYRPEPTLSLPPPPEEVAVVYPPEPEEIAAAQANSAVVVTSVPAGGAVTGGGFSPAGKTTSRSDKSVHVSGYTTKNGTHVAPYTRGAPGTGTHKSKHY